VAVVAFAAFAPCVVKADTFVLVQSVIVSRHGIRTPYPPSNGTVDDFSSYTYKQFPDNSSWGMPYESFSEQV
jgi:hypothetical protein